MNNKDLIKQYVDTGLILPEYQVMKLSGNDRKTYIRKRLLYIKQTNSRLKEYEYNLIDDPNVLLNIFKSFLHTTAGRQLIPANYANYIEDHPVWGPIVNRLKVISPNDDIVDAELLKLTVANWDRINFMIPSKYAKYLAPEAVVPYANRKLADILYNGKGELADDNWIVDYADETIQKYVQTLSTDKGYFDLIDEWNAKPERVFNSIIKIFLREPEFNKHLTGKQLFYLTLYLDEQWWPGLFKAYMENGGSMEVIESYPKLLEKYKKYF